MISADLPSPSRCETTDTLHGMEQLKPIHIIRASHRVAERFERHLTIHVAGIYVVMPKGRSLMATFGFSSAEVAKVPEIWLEKRCETTASPRSSSASRGPAISC